MVSAVMSWKDNFLLTVNYETWRKPCYMPEDEENTYLDVPGNMTIFLVDQTGDFSAKPGSGRSSRSMQILDGTARKIIHDNMVDSLDVDSPGRNVRTNEIFDIL